MTDDLNERLLVTLARLGEHQWLGGDALTVEDAISAIARLTAARDAAVEEAGRLRGALKDAVWLIADAEKDTLWTSGSGLDDLTAALNKEPS